MQIQEIKIDNTNIKFFDDFINERNKLINLQIFENVLGNILEDELAA